MPRMPVRFTIVLTLSTFIIYITVWLFSTDNSHQMQLEKKFQSNNLPISKQLNVSQISYIVNGSWICNESSVLMIFVIISSPTHYVERNRYRHSWTMTLSRNTNTRLVFLTGSSSKYGHKSLKSLKYEAKIMEDLIIIDFVESYHNLSLKTVLMLRWIKEFCPQAAFVLKSHEDTFINYHNTLKYVRSLNPNTASFYGMLLHKKKPSRNISDIYEKWSVTEQEYSNNYYPDYVLGGAYLFSTKKIDLLLDVCVDIPYLYLEDVFVTGMCARAAKYSHVNHDKFVYQSILYDICSVLSIFTGHGFTRSQQIMMWTYYLSDQAEKFCKKRSLASRKHKLMH